MLPLSQWLIGSELRWFRLWLGLGLVLIAAVFYMSLTPVDIPAEHFDKIYHAATYAIVMGWFAQLYTGLRSHTLLALAFILMGALIEVLQGFHPMRYFDVLDMLANAIGVAIAWLLARFGLSRLLLGFESLIRS